MFISLFCLLKQGMIENNLFFHILFPLSIVEMIIEMIVINLIESVSQKRHIDTDEMFD